MDAARDVLLTAESLYHLSDEDGKHELVGGRLVSEPLPGARHGRVSATLAAVLTSFVRARGLGAVLVNDTGFVLARNPDTVRGPDVAFIGADRVADADAVGFVPGPPDLAVEVLSPGNRPGDVHGKVADYLAAGTRLVWVVDPGTRSVTVYRSLLSPRRLVASELLEGEDVVAGFSVPVEELFRV